MKKLLFLLAFANSITLFAQQQQAYPLKVSSLFKDHMVLQQNSSIKFSGQSTPGEKVNISTNWGKAANATAESTGKWSVELDAPKAGGPYNISITCLEVSIDISDVLIGEVWFASGQSNMDIPLKGWPPGDTILNSNLEIQKANYPNIRFFKVPFRIATQPSDSVNGTWTVVNPQTAGDFSATAYFFAKKLYDELGIPIGIVQSSIGGTPAEAWTSKEGLKNIGDFTAAVDNLDSLGQASKSWFSRWSSAKIPVSALEWKNMEFADKEAIQQKYDDSRWVTVELPGNIDRIYNQEINGAVLLRKNFILEDNNLDYLLKLGSVDDMEYVYVNGQYIGSHLGQGRVAEDRTLVIPKSVLLRGNNTISIRVVDTGGPGFIKGALVISNDKGNSIALSGKWQATLVAEIFENKLYVYGVQSAPLARPDVAKLNSNTPTVLYNAMVHPLISYNFRGIIWYQGESNVGRAEQYKSLFPAMIQDWRAKFGQVLPFYYVQIAPNLYTAANQKEQSPKLRDAQRYGLFLPKTGMVSTLDLGSNKTVHPPNKQDVGLRLARLALANNYGKSIMDSGPSFKDAKISGNEIILSFKSVGKGLVLNNNNLANFEVAGEDKIYLRATARISGNHIIVANSSISKPQYARYAWTDGSVATLFNKDGLPAATFTTEN